MTDRDILSHSKKTAEDNEIDVASYIINYIDHEMITSNLVDRFDRDCIDTRVDNQGSITVLFKTGSAEDLKSFSEELSSVIETSPYVEVSGSKYILALTNIDNGVGVKISPYTV